MSFIDNGILVAIIAHGLIGLSLVWDKVLLLQPETRDLMSYVFWLGAMSVLGLLLLPFGFQMPPLSVAALGLITGVLHLVAIGFYYAALNAGEASHTLAIMGGFSPVATALFGLGLLSKPLDGDELGFALMTAGGFAMFFSERFGVRTLLPMILIASGLFGFTNVLKKVVYDNTNFVTGYVFFTFGIFVAAMFLLARRRWRKQILETSGEASPRSRFWYFANRFGSGLGSFLIFYAISLANPAIVDAIGGIRYVLVFIGAFLLTRLKPEWLRENFGRWTLVWKTLGTLLVAAGLVLVGLNSEPSETAGRKPAPAWQARAPVHNLQVFQRFLTTAAFSHDGARRRLTSLNLCSTLGLAFMRFMSGV